MEKIYTIDVQEIKQVTGLGINKVYKLVKQGYFPAHKIDNKYVIPRETFFAWFYCTSVEKTGEKSLVFLQKIRYINKS